MNIEQSESREVFSSQYFPKVSYPAVKILSTILSVIAWIGAIVFVILFITSLVKAIDWDSSTMILASFGKLLAGVVWFIFTKALSELLIVFTDMSISAREILIHLNERGSNE
jgi:hypothetical protein